MMFLLLVVSKDGFRIVFLRIIRILKEKECDIKKLYVAFISKELTFLQL